GGRVGGERHAGVRGRGARHRGDGRRGRRGRFRWAPADWDLRGHVSTRYCCPRRITTSPRSRPRVGLHPAARGETTPPQHAFGWTPMSTSDPSLQLSRPSRLIHLRSRRRLVAGLALALVAILMVVGSGAGLGVYHDQQARLTQARADRAAAKKVIDAAVARAQSDGITGTQLAPVLSAESALMAGSPVAPHFGWFDN